MRLLKLGLTFGIFFVSQGLHAEPAPMQQSFTPDIEIHDPAASQWLGDQPALEKIAQGFQFIEGPLWRGDHLLFSDIPANRVYRWSPGTITTLIAPVHDPAMLTGATGGSNGLIADANNDVLMFIHGLRRVERFRAGQRTVVARHWQKKKFNSPNDGVLHSSGAVFFTDPPYGLAKQDKDPNKEIPVNGIYRLDSDGTVNQLASMHRPNGIGLSPDEKTLYVASSDMTEKWWMRFPVRSDLSLGEGRIHFDARHIDAPGVPDGFDVDRAGNLWASGPGGVVVIDSEGTHLATIRMPEQPANATFNTDETVLYLTARTGLYRLSLNAR